MHLTDRNATPKSGHDRPTFDIDDLVLLPAAKALAGKLSTIGGTPWDELDESGKHFYLACVEIVSIYLRK